jgi:carbamoyl-phosphate synthase large subunit
MNTFRVDNQRELDFFVQYVPDPIIQEFLPGPEITCDVVCDLDGTFLAAVQRQRIAVRGGEAIKSRTVSLPGLESACQKIAAALPACGPITVQCMLKENQPYFIEINARLGGGLPLAIAAGLDVPSILLAMVSDLEAKRFLVPYRVGMTMTRCDESIFLLEGDRERLESHRL